MKLVVFSFLFVSCININQGETCHGCLKLTPFIRNGTAELARTSSAVDPDYFLGINSHAGYITVKDEFDSNMFFWYFPVSGNVTEKPWILWLQGGPGYTSLVGLFDLIGPLYVEDGKLQQRNVTWANDYSLLFVDNPVGSGFSYTANQTGIPDNEDDVGSQLYDFLQQFLQVFPELRHAPLLVAGESYAGKYVPALAMYIHRYKNTTHPVNLKGISMGNALVDPRSMMHYSQLCRELGLLDDHELREVKRLEETVVRLIDSKKMIEASNKFNETIEYIRKKSGVNIYNYMQDCRSSAPEFDAFVTKREVRDKIHAGDAHFDLNNQAVYQRMLPDIMNTTKMWVEELLEHYGVLSYSGQLDIILAYSLSKHMYDELKWSRRHEYVAATRRKLRKSRNTSVVAYKKSGGNFVEVLIRGAGHMVAVEQPEVTKFIIDSFIEDYVQ